MAKLGRLIEVPLREIWSHEQYDFSKWLAKEENLELLGEQLGLSLTEPETEGRREEKTVGRVHPSFLC